MPAPVLASIMAVSVQLIALALINQCHLSLDSFNINLW